MYLNKYLINYITKTSKLFKCIKTHRKFSTIIGNDKIPKTIDICNKTYQIDEMTNVTPKILSLIGRNIYKIKSNPLYLISEGIKQYFNDYEIFDHPSPVVDLATNFDSLLIPKDHVSRERSQTYYVNKDYVLRSHTSAHEIECHKTNAKRFICIADVYRRDEIDSKHYAAFHQCEIAQTYDRSDNMLGVNDIFERSPNNRIATKQECHTLEAAKRVEFLMKNTIEGYIKHLLGKSIEMRWVNAYFPFTHPSYELEIFFNNNWMEILGAGIIEHKLLVNSGINDRIGWALGFGLERLAMLRYDIPDIRLFWTKDTGFLHQFENANVNDRIKYKPISSYPQCINDISFWIPENDWNVNDFYDIVRSIGGETVEHVKLIDEYKNKSGKVSNCFRIVYRSYDRVLTQSQVNDIHKQIEQNVCEQLKVEIR